MAWPAVPAVGGRVNVKFEDCEDDAWSVVVKLVEAFPKRSCPMLLAEPRVKDPGIVTGMPDLPMTTAVEEAVPRFRVPAPSTVTAPSPSSPELLTVNMAWAVRVTEPKRQRTPRSR
jgi:hypothetical protein